MDTRQPSRMLFKRFDEPRAHGEILCGDALEFLGMLDPDSADLVFLDPPFNLGKRYAKEGPNGDRRPVEDYAAWLARILDESVRVMARGSALFMYHLPIWAIR